MICCQLSDLLYFVGTREEESNFLNLSAVFRIIEKTREKITNIFNGDRTLQPTNYPLEYKIFYRKMFFVDNKKINAYRKIANKFYDRLQMQF